MSIPNCFDATTVLIYITTFVLPILEPTQHILGGITQHICLCGAPLLPYTVFEILHGDACIFQSSFF